MHYTTQEEKFHGIYTRGDLTERILIECEAGPLQTATAMAKRLNESPATVSGMLARMVKQGRVKRIQATEAHVAENPETVKRVGAWVY